MKMAGKARERFLQMEAHGTDTNEHSHKKVMSFSTIYRMSICSDGAI